MKELNIRRADAGDTEALASLVAERGFGYPTDVALVRERLEELTRAGDLVLLAIDEEKIVGMALLHRTRFLHRPADGRISALVVSESCRGRGIGTRLLEAAEAVFRQWGCARVEVSSGATREGAHRFYLRAGFSEQPKRFIKLL